MKARVKSTGQIVEVVYDVDNCSASMTYYKDIKSRISYRASDLEFIYDLKDPDWEQRRYEIAKSAMQGIIANSHDKDYRVLERYSSYDSWRKEYPNEIAETAVSFADALIAELKKKGE